MDKKISLLDSKLDYNQLYVCTRRAVISFFARGFCHLQGYDDDDFQFVMLFVKKSYQAFYKSLEDVQKGEN